MDGATAVVTGASSGLGRATALALADHGTAVVVAARDAEALDEVVADCRRRGVAALAVPTDVTSEPDVEALGARAQDEFGGYDLWVNAAAVMAYGAVEDVPTETWRRVVETNLFGYLHGCRVALAHFRERGHGVVVNVGSVYGRITSPFVSPYVSSKFAIVGLTRSLRQEIRHLADVHVCQVLPEAVDTPIYRHAANHTGREVTALPATMAPERVVRTILRQARRPRRERVVGLLGRVLMVGERLAPALYEWAAPIAMERLALRSEDAPESTGNVFAPMPEHNRVDGGFRAQRRTLRRVAAAGLATVAVTPVAAWWWRRRRRV
nr:SDR family NAD(P)-dependent oxidoreductase [Salsipaludibacter albus]